MKTKRARENGVALLLTLLVVTLVAVVVVEFTYSTEVDAHVTRNALSATQAHYLARSGVALAEVALRVDAEKKALSAQQSPPVETLSDTWARPFPPLPIDGAFGAASFSISDETSKFNLNSLAIAMRGNPTVLEMRKQLLQAVLEAVGADGNLVFPLVDWVDMDDTTDRESGAERSYYQRREPPYEPRNGFLLGFDELAMVRGFEALTRAQWTALRRLVTVLPTADLRINLNTAPPELLNALGASVGASGLGDTISRSRESRPIQSIAEMNQLPGMSSMPPLARAMFDVRSTYFRIHAVGVAGDARRGITVLLERPRGATRLRIVDWSEEAASTALTSSGASAGIGGSSLP